MTAKTSLKNARQSKIVKSSRSMKFSVLLKTRVTSEVFANRDMRESARRRKADVFLFSRMYDRLCVSFSHSPARTRLMRVRTL